MSVDHERPELPLERLIGRLSRIDGPTFELTSGRDRVSFEFDALDPEIAAPLEAVDLDAMDELVRGVSALRISTTLTRYRQFTLAEPVVGDWYIFTLTRERPKKGLVIWRAPLSVAGFADSERVWATSAERLFNDESLPKGAPPWRIDVSLSLYLDAETLAAASSFPSAAVVNPEDVPRLFDDAMEARKVTVRDVGQAAYACVRDAAGRVLMYFDVGWPMPFNKKTAPRGFVPDAERVPIALSHWDWDHLQAAFHFKHFLECTWIAPVQKLGPGAARLAMALHKKGRLVGLKSGVALLPFGSLACCTGPSTSTNDSGLALSVDLPNDFKVLLVGDAAYQSLPPGWHAPIDGLVVTHHGAKFAGGHTTIPPPKRGRRRAIASYGEGNTYKHPHPDAVHDHKVAGWTALDPTASKGRGARRGDRHFPR